MQGLEITNIGIKIFLCLNAVALILLLLNKLFMLWSTKSSTLKFLVYMSIYLEVFTIVCYLEPVCITESSALTSTLVGCIVALICYSLGVLVTKIPSVVKPLLVRTYETHIGGIIHKEKMYERTTKKGKKIYYIKETHKKR